MKEISEAKVIADNINVVKIVKGVVISCIITLILLFIFAILLTYTNLGENTIGSVIIGITGASILAGSSMTTSSIRKNGIINGGLIGLIYILLIYLISSIAWERFCFKHIFLYNDDNWNYSRNDRRNSWS